MTEVWKRLLGLESIGIDDNFFELGGHSLTAVRLVADIERLMGIRIPMSTLFEAPTVRKLAGLLSTEGWTPQWSCLVPVCTTGSLPPVFCVHGSGSEVLWLSGMSRELGTDQPFYGLQPQGSGRSDRAAATHRGHGCTSTSPRSVVSFLEGPYYLLGYSLGGAVAFEMARQLEANGQRVAFLGLIDSGFPGVQSTREIPLLVRLKLHAKAIASRGPSDAIRYTGHRVRSLWRRTVAHLRPKAAVVSEADTDSRAAAQHVESASVEAWKSYVPGVWNGKLTYFASTDRGETIW